MLNVAKWLVYTQKDMFIISIRDIKVINLLIYFIKLKLNYKPYKLKQL